MVVIVCECVYIYTHVIIRIIVIIIIIIIIISSSSTSSSISIIFNALAQVSCPSMVSAKLLTPTETETCNIGYMVLSRTGSPHRNLHRNKQVS